MGRSGDCVTCDNRKRPAIETARAKGESFASIARRFGLAEASVRRHFKAGHVRKPEPKPAPRSAAPPPERTFGAWVTMEPAPTMRFSELREAVSGIPAPLAVVVCAIADVALVDLTTDSDAENEELYDLFAEGNELLAGLRLEY